MPPARLPLLVALALCGASASAAPMPKQEKAERVRAARAEKGDAVRALFEAKGLPYPAKELLLRSFKQEGELELWASAKKGGSMVLVKTYAVCAKSGDLGPKRKAGDLQVPEGFYEVDRYNAWSDFHLSLGINYPNDVDRVLGWKEAKAAGKGLGYNIFIHGDCVTIGCIPIEDGPIEEVFLAALDTKVAHGGRLQVQLYPARLTDDGMAGLAADHDDRPELVAFWRNLKEGYDLFERDPRRLRVIQGKDGRYRYSPRRR